jgi:hypothetical protein
MKEHKKKKKTPGAQKENLKYPVLNKDTALRKDFFRRLLYIAMAAIPLILLANEKGPLRFLSLAGFLVIIVQFIIIIGFLQSYIDEFFPPKLLREHTTKPFDKFMYYFAAVMFPLGLFSCLFEMGKMDRTIGGFTLMMNWGFIGIGAAFAVIIILHIFNPSVYYESKRRITIYASLLLGWFLLFPTVASFINHTFSDDIITCKNYRVLRKSTGSKGARFMFLKTEADDDERFDITKEFYNKISERGVVILCTKNGKLGYKVVTEFRK